jgi:hypothetical protein
MLPWSGQTGLPAKPSVVLSESASQNVVILLGADPSLKTLSIYG